MPFTSLMYRGSGALYTFDIYRQHLCPYTLIMQLSLLTSNAANIYTFFKNVHLKKYYLVSFYIHKSKSSDAPIYQKCHYHLLQLFTREMSSWLGFDASGGAWLCADTRLGGDFYRCFLGRCQDSLVLVPREMSRQFGFGSSGDVKKV